MKTRAYFFQFGFRYGNEVYLPYSVGALWAYARTLPEIDERYENAGFVFLRDDPDRIVTALDRPQVAAYSTGVFDELLAQSFDFAAVWETNRGCPYACTFCDWGSAIAQKLSVWDPARLDREIEYFGQKRIRYVYAADANFGILPRDVDI